MKERMLLACENGTPIELPDGRGYFIKTFIKSDIQNLHDIFSDLENDAKIGGFNVF